MPPIQPQDTLIARLSAELLYHIVEYAYLSRQAATYTRMLHIDYHRLLAIHRAGFAPSNPCAHDFFFLRHAAHPARAV